MPDAHDSRDAIHEAERAAAAGNFARAEALLRRALDDQERQLGTAHPDLASTLNNLAVVCETNGRLEEAEQFYRRAFAVATAALPHGDPLIATSRANLEDFCRAHGRPVDDWPELSRATDAPTARAVPVAPPKPRPAPAAAPAIAPTPRAGTASPAPPRTTVPPPAASAPPAPEARPSGLPRGFAGALAVLAIGGTLVAAWLALTPERASVATSAPAADAAPPPSGAAGPTPPSPTEPATVTPAPVPPVAATPDPAAPPTAAAVPAPPPADRAPAAPAPTPSRPATSALPVAAPAEGGSALRVVDARVCRQLLRGGGAWRCEPVTQPVSAGPMVFYTRVAAARAGRLEHRWYRDDRLARTVGLTIAASPSDGYRTYSQQTVSPGHWRVELCDPSGRIVHEAAFEVR